MNESIRKDAGYAQLPDCPHEKEEGHEIKNKQKKYQ